MFPDHLLAAATDLLAACRGRGRRVATAESCTGGLIAALLTEIAGSSDVFERGFVTYSNEAKRSLLRVSEALLAQHGAVSAEVAQAMAQGAIGHSNAELAVAVTGIAGPGGGGTEEKPVGLVYIAAVCKGAETIVEMHHFPGDRQAVRLAAVAAGMALLTRVNS